MSRLLGSPVLSGALLLLWLLLRQESSAGTLVTGAVLALLVTAFTSPLRPTRYRVRRPVVAARLAAAVVMDSLRSSATVMTMILRRPDGLRSGFVRIPLQLRSRAGLAALAAIVTATPGTAWAELTRDGSTLLLHVLDVEDEARLVATVKERYERPLLEIFE